MHSRLGLNLYSNTCNTELNDLRTVSFRKPKVSVERTVVRNVVEKLEGHGIHYLPCSFTNDVIDLFP